MMDPQQIRDALRNPILESPKTKEFIDINWPSSLIDLQTVVDSAAEYADLLEGSERIWWCGVSWQTYPSAAGQAECDYKGHTAPNWPCGWRLLTPTNAGN